MFPSVVSGRRFVLSHIFHFIVCIMHQAVKAQVYLLRPDVTSISHRAQLATLLPFRPCIILYWNIIKTKHIANSVVEGKTVTKDNELLGKPATLMSLHQSDNWLYLEHSQVFFGVFFCVLCLVTK